MFSDDLNSKNTIIIGQPLHRIFLMCEIYCFQLFVYLIQGPKNLWGLQKSTMAMLNFYRALLWNDNTYQVTRAVMTHMHQHNSGYAPRYQLDIRIRKFSDD